MGARSGGSVHGTAGSIGRCMSGHDDRCTHATDPMETSACQAQPCPRSSAKRYAPFLSTIRRSDDPTVPCASIALTLGSDAPTISREVGRNGGRERYRAVGAQQRAHQEAKRPRLSLLVADQVLACLVRADLDKGFSPAACAARLRRSGAAAICHESTYGPHSTAAWG